MRRFSVLLCCSVAACLLGLEAEQDTGAPQTTFRSGVDVVDVDVSVLDRNRLPVRDLTAADFTVLEDGKARPIVAFSSVDLPPRELPSARWMTDVAPDVLDNAFPREGRLVVLLMDRSIGVEHLPAAQAFAVAAVDQLRPGDLAAVAYSTFGIPQNFTADRARLLAAIRQPVVGLPEDDDGSPTDCFCGVCSLETVADVAEAMLPVRQRRKMLLVVGANMSIQSSGPCGGLLAPARRRALRALEAGNVTVHAFDPTGIQTLMPSASAAGGAGSGARSPVAAALARRGNISVLPGHTGGRVVGDPVRPADRVAELFRESNSYYVLGFQPAGTVPGRFHRIEVKVGRKDVTLQARRGYYAAEREPDATVEGRPPVSGISAGLRTAIAGLWPRTDFALSLAAAPVARPTLERATVAAVIGSTMRLDQMAPALPLSGPGISPVVVVNVLVGAFDRRGHAVATERQTVSLTPTRAGVGARSLPYEVIARLDLKPGRYELRAAVEESGAGQSGSVYSYVDVPDYRREPVAMSGLVVEAEPARMSSPAQALGDLLPVVPTARRVFSRTDRVRGFVRVYQGLERAVIPGYVVAEILNQRDQSVFRQESRVVPAQFGASRAMDFMVDLPIARLEPGEYVLSVDARHGTATARRDARFRIVP